MRTFVVAGGTWHQDGLISGLRALGHETVEISPRAFTPADRLLRVGNNLQKAALLRLPYGQEAWAKWFGSHASRVLKSHITPDDVVLGWSSFLTEILAWWHGHAVVIRGSHHIETQAGKLGAFGPSPIIVRRELREYVAASAVTVPTAEIAADPNWVRNGARPPVVSPYGFPEFHGMRRERVPGRVVVVGALSYRKGTDRVYESSAGTGWEVVLVGKRARREHITKPPPSEVMLRGQLKPEIALQTVATAEVFLSLSREEGMQRAGQEAIALGVPVVATREAGLGVWLSRGCGIEIGDYTPARVQQAIRSVLLRREQHSRICGEVSSSWTWTDHVREVLKVLI
jgi:glycosyltransferase involved in cell wall biosynthesis